MNTDMKTLLLVPAMILGLGVASVAHAEVKVHPVAKVQLEPPAGWKIQGGKDDMVLLEPNEDVIIFLRVLEGSDLKKAIHEAKGFIKKSIADVKWGAKDRDQDLNGMKAMLQEGSGKYKGKDVEIGVIVITTPSKKPLLVYGIMDHSRAATLQPHVDAFLNSIKPAP